MPTDETVLVESLVGRTIVRAKWFVNDEEAWLWLDDGRVIEFGGTGYDDSGAATVNEIELVDVEDCLHCHQPHGERVIYGLQSWHDKPLPRRAYCLDGNHIAWEEPSPP